MKRQHNTYVFIRMSVNVLTPETLDKFRHDTSTQVKNMRNKIFGDLPRVLINQSN